MKANELRIGNWIQANGECGVIEKGTWCLVDSIENKFMTAIIHFKQSQNLSRSAYSRFRFSVIDSFKEQCDPIPLTPEVLEKSGFESNMVEGIASIEDHREEGNTFYWQKKSKSTHTHESYTFNIVRWGESGDLIFSNHWLRIKLTSLHQLQNLYFALTGEELEINLSSN